VKVKQACRFRPGSVAHRAVCSTGSHTCEALGICAAADTIVVGHLAAVRDCKWDAMPGLVGAVGRRKVGFGARGTRRAKQPKLPGRAVGHAKRVVQLAAMPQVHTHGSVHVDMTSYRRD